MNAHSPQRRMLRTLIPLNCQFRSGRTGYSFDPAILIGDLRPNTTLVCHPFLGSLHIVYSSQTPGSSKRKCKVAWSCRYECDHAGTPRDRRNADLSPRKRRNREASIKCGCTAKIYACQSVGADKVEVRYHWEHNGHGARFNFKESTFSLIIP